MIPALYIHIPFCRKRCHYCDFFSVKTSLFDDPDLTVDLFILALEKELEIYSSKYLDNVFSTLYIGGGTPSLIPVKSFERLITKLYKSFQFHPDCEWTMELNPESLTREKLIAYKDLGVNRMSLGCQTFNDDILKLIGRETTKKEIIDKYDLIRDMGFDNINLDFIFGLPGQSFDHYVNDIKTAVELQPNHFSCYELTLGNSLLSHQILTDNLAMPSEDLVRREYLWTIDYLAEKAYQLYEVSNFAQKGKESRHNNHYWNQDNYLALGPSAVGTIDSYRYSNMSSVKKYITELEKGELPIGYSETLDVDKIRTEKIMLSLRLKKGLDLGFLENVEEPWLKRFNHQLNQLVSEGYLLKLNNRVLVTQKGLIYLNQIILKLV